jgi:hypothetical protein
MVDDMQQQESISFDQLGSLVEYLRAHGPDIVLNIEDVLAGKYRAASSSSSSSEVSSTAEIEVQSSFSPSFQVLEMRAFQ